MSSNFSFAPMGLSQQVTVVATAGTVTFSIVQLGGATATLSSTGTPFRPKAVRVINLGTVPAFIQFGVTAPTVSLATGMAVTAAANYYGEDIFVLNGAAAMAHISAGTTTLNITPGEGL